MWSHGALQHPTSDPDAYGPVSRTSSFYDAELSQLNSMCDDNTRLCARELNPQCMQQLMDAYFLYHHNQPYSFFHEEHLREDLTLGLVPDHLISAICAIAIRFTADHDPQKRAALAFSRSSWASVSQLDMDADGEFDLEVVQSLTLLAIFEYTGLEYTERASQLPSLTFHRSKTTRCVDQVWACFSSCTSVGDTS